MRSRSLALGLIVAAAAWRIAAVHALQLSNFSPVMALAFCGGLYFAGGWMWLVPFAAIAASDLFIDRYYAVTYHYSWMAGGAVIRLACFAAALLLGRQLAARRSWARIFSGCLGASVLFYLVTNTASFLGDAFYPKNLDGWWQALTIGHPGFPSTIYFFRNTLVSDLVFTGLFALAVEFAARRQGEPSLLAAQAR